MTSRGVQIVCGVATIVIAGFCWAYGGAPRSFFEAQRDQGLTQEERAKLDFELANEYSMGGINGRRFRDAEERAQWFWRLAKDDEVADLLQQTFDFENGMPRNYEPAVRRLIELGRQGHPRAACFGEFAYRHQSRDVTETWRYTYDDAARLALLFSNSHPVCATVAGNLYRFGLGGFSQNDSKAKAEIMRAANAGLFWSQVYMAGTHLQPNGHRDPVELEKELCWKRVADRQSPQSFFHSTCQALREGIGIDAQGKPFPVSSEIKAVASRWCAADGPLTRISAEDCIQLER